MSQAIKEGEHKFGPVEGGKPLDPHDSLDIGPRAVVHMHCGARVLFVWGKGELHLHHQVDEVWAWGESKLHIHVPVRVQVSGRAEVHCDAPGALVIATERAQVHFAAGVRVLAYDDAEVFGPSGLEVSLNGYALHHTTDGRTIGHRPLYRSQIQVRHY